MVVADQVRRIMRQHLGVDAPDLAPQALVPDGVGADSLDAYELPMAFEDAFSIEIPDADAECMQCVQDAIPYNESHATVGGGRVSP